MGAFSALTWACVGVIAVSMLSDLPRAAGFIAPTIGGSRLASVPARATACQGSRSRRGAGLRSAGRSLHGLRCSETGDSGGKAEGTPELVDPATLAFADGLKEHLAGIWGPTGAFLRRCLCIMHVLCAYSVVITSILPHLPGGEDFSLYSPSVEFKDPLASYTGIDTYKKALSLLKDSKISNGVRFETHDVSIAGNGVVRARWTLSAECPLLPWKPRVVFTGVSVYTLNTEGKVVKHVDIWDSCDEGELPLIGGDLYVCVYLYIC